jgi:hypothetical protein
VSFRSSSVRLARGWGPLGFLAAVAPVLLFVVGGAFVEANPALGFGLVGSSIGWLAGVVAGYFASGRRRAERGDLSLDEAGVHWNGELAIARKDIRHALVVPRKEGVVVELTRAFGATLTLEVASAAEGEEVLRALGFAVDQRRMQDAMPTAMGFSGATYVGVLATVMPACTAAIVGLAALLGKTPLLPLAIVVPVLAMFTAIMWPTRLSLGADGILVKWMWRERFVRYEQVASLERVGNGLSLVLHDGSRFMVVPEYNRYGVRVEAVIERIREAMTLRREGGRAPVAAALARGGRPARDWLDALRSIERAAEGGPRTAPISTDDLWRVLADPGAEDGVRAGAAAALHAALGEEAGERLRVASQAIAAPKLRLAVEHAAAGDEEALLEALEELEEPAETGNRA